MPVSRPPARLSALDHHQVFRSPHRRLKVRLRLEWLEDRTAPAVYTVLNTDDSGADSLRQAILDANDNPGADEIHFNIGGGGVQTINPTTALPDISDPVVIDGTTQPGFAGTPIIELNGSLAGTGANGLLITTNNSTVRGLVINRFGGHGIVITGSAATSNVVQGNYLGTDITGTIDLGNTLDGVRIEAGAMNNTIGGSVAAARNLISGNNSDGVEITGSGTSNNIVLGNYIGVAGNGNGLTANTVSWWKAEGSANDTVDGNHGTLQNGATFAAGVVGQAFLFDGVNDYVSAPDANNMDITGPITLEAWINPTTIAGNLRTIVGKRNADDFNLTYALFLQADGRLSFTSRSNGGAFATAISTAVIPLNQFTHVAVTISGSTLTFFVNGAAVTTLTYTATRTASTGPLTLGITSINTGLFFPFVGRIDELGIYNRALAATEIQAIHAAGSAGKGTVLGNSAHGVFITGGAADNIIGTNGDGVTDTTEGNLISGHSLMAGVRIDGLGSDNNRVAGNFIGLNAAGTGQIANRYGVYIAAGAKSNVIGTNGDGVGDTAERNVVSGNTSTNVWITDSGTEGNRVAGNYIGTNSAGTARLVSTGSTAGVVLDMGAKFNIIGTNGDGAGDADERNVISGNTFIGVAIGSTTGLGVGTEHNVIAGNYIGLNATGTAAVENNLSGIQIAFGARNTRIGTNADGISDTLERNVISGNRTNGVNLSGGGDHIVAGNYIGLNAAGNAAIPNSTGTTTGAVSLAGGSTNNRVGTNADGVNDAIERNVISGNLGAGVLLSGAGTSANMVAGNFIGLDAGGTFNLGNNNTGIVIQSQAATNTIGGVVAAAGNVISGNNLHGISIASGSSGNVVQGNYVGTDATGTFDVGNTSDGVRIEGNANNNTIGGSAAGAGNVISGNDSDGIEITGSGTNNNVVAGNYIGTNKDGDALIVPGTVSWWRAENTTADSADGNGGTLFNGATYAAGMVGQAFNFDGNDDYFQAPTTGMPIGNANRTLSLWVKLDAAVATEAFFAGYGAFGSVNQAYALGATGTTLFFSQWGTGVTGSSLALNTWYHVAVTNVGNSVTLYLNGVSVGTATVTINTPAATQFYVGRIPGILGDGRRLDGSVDEVTVYNRALSAGEIAGAYAAGTVGSPFGAGNGGCGVRIVNGASSNRIGTNGDGVADATERNVISGNNQHGVRIAEGGSTQSNIVAGNFIGTNAFGTASLGNYFSGVAISVGANNNRIGTDGNGVGDVAERNVISGNMVDGVIIAGSGTNYNIVAGNYIGTDVTGMLDLGNAVDGVRIEAGASNNTIGGSVAGARNILSGNNNSGVVIYGTGTSNNVVAGNYLGTNATGIAAIPNSHGISVDAGASGTIIGGNASSRNVVSGNTWRGIAISGAPNTVIAGNYIGTSADGMTSLGGQVFQGILLFGAANTRIGTDGDGINDATEGNVISGNGGQGIQILEPTSSATIAGNIIGLDALGVNSVGTQGGGINIGDWVGTNVTGAVRIGTDANGISDGLERNIISGNTSFGILITGGGPGKIVSGNYIGTTIDGAASAGWQQWGVILHSGTSGNVVGGAAAGPGNVISGNALAGVFLGSANNLVAGNLIGVDKNGVAAIPNGVGVRIADGATGNTIGGTVPGEGNLIAFNMGPGVLLTDTTSGNRILGNAIHSNSGLAIDIGDDGVTPNDPGDADTGPNNGLNFPELFSVTPGDTTHITGTLDSPGNGPFTIEFFVSDSADPSGFGEGQTFLDRWTLDTDGVFDIMLPVTTTPGTWITATVTDAFGNTSEFSLAMMLEYPLPSALIDFAPAVGVPGQSLTFDFSAFSPNAEAMAAGFEFVIDWGDESEDTTIAREAGQTAVNVSHSYAAIGTFTVTVTVTDAFGGTAMVEHQIEIDHIQRVGGVVFAAGSSWGDVIEIQAGGPTEWFLEGDGVHIRIGIESGTDFIVFVEGLNGADDYTVTFGGWGGVSLFITDAGASGEDSLTVLGTNQDDYFNKQDGIVQWGNPAQDTIFFSGIEHLTLRGEDGNDIFSDPGTATTILGGLGDDTIMIDATFGSGIFADGGEGSDTYLIQFGNLLAPVTILDSGTTGTDHLTLIAATDGGPLSINTTQATQDGQLVNFVMPATGVTVTSPAGSTPVIPTNMAVVVEIAPGQTSLAVGGTAGNDTIILTPGGSGGAVTAKLNGVVLGSYSPTGDIIAFGLAGDDDLQVAGSISRTAWLYGGAGHDRLKGGDGHDVLLGGDGDDLVIGGNGRDLLIGGIGSDRLVGNAEDDILIAGVTAFDGQNTALGLILAEWTSARSYGERLANLQGTGTGSSWNDRLNGTVYLDSNGADASVFNDDSVDILTGSSGQDWFIFNADGDGVHDISTDLHNSEFFTDLDIQYINGP